MENIHTDVRKRRVNSFKLPLVRPPYNAGPKKNLAQKIC